MEADNQRKRFIHGPHLLHAEATNRFTGAPDISDGHLFNKNARRLRLNCYLGTKGRGKGAQ